MNAIYGYGLMKNEIIFVYDGFAVIAADICFFNNCLFD